MSEEAGRAVEVDDLRLLDSLGLGVADFEGKTFNGVLDSGFGESATNLMGKELCTSCASSITLSLKVVSVLTLTLILFRPKRYQIRR